MLLGSSLAVIASGCTSQAHYSETVQSGTAADEDNSKPAPDNSIVDDPNVVGSDDVRGPPGDSVDGDPNVVRDKNYSDPLMPMNRFIFQFNNVAARYVLVPLSKGYLRIVPDPVERSIGNFFDNARTPVYAVNSFFQGKLKSSGKNLSRFGINTTIGLLGIFDPAKSWFGLERSPTDFADTLAHYNVGHGAYLVLPIFGPSDFRGATARGVDYFLQPIPYLLDQRDAFAVLAFGTFNDFSKQAESYEKVREGLDDPYVFFRNLHLQGIERDAAYRQ